MIKRSKNVPVGTITRLKTKKGSSTPTAKKTRSTGRHVEVKIRLTAEEYSRGLPYFDEDKYLSKFCKDAYMEKVTRAESNSKAGRVRVLAGNMELLEPILREMWQQGKLNFLNGGDGKWQGQKDTM